MEKKGSLYLKEVTEQIHSKEARKFVFEELNYHLTEAKKAWQAKGLSDVEAEEKAIDQMGSAVSLGNQLNKLHRPRIDWYLVVLLITTLALSFLPIISLGYMQEQHFSTNKVIFVLLGGAIAMAMMLIDYQKFKKIGWLFYLIGILILLTIRFFSNTMINGLPLLKIGPITVEGSMAVPFFFLAWSSFFNDKRLKIWHFGFLSILPFYLFLSMPSVSTCFIYIVMVIVMLWWSKMKRKTVILISAITAGTFFSVGLVGWKFTKTYQKERLLAFLNPEKYSTGSGYTILHIKKLMSEAGWFVNHEGREFIPEAHTNFVFASFTYYYGWLFAIALVLILCLFVARMIIVINKIHDSHGKLLLIGAVTLYSVQLVTNLAMTLGLFPLTTMSLPFISYGLMPVLLNSALIGIVLSVYRRKDLISRSVI